MSYKSFKNISKVCKEFKLSYDECNFIKEKEIQLDKYFLKTLEKYFTTRRTFCSEGSICEKIIGPILNIIGDENRLPVWSHVKLNATKQLRGETDYLLAPEEVGGYEWTTPVVCIGEAKKDDFIGGWGQVGAEMYAAQIVNIQRIKEEKGKEFNEEIESKIQNVTIYGLVSNGKDWEFGKLINKSISINKDAFKCPRELQKVFDTLNWMFCEARKNADQLLMLNS